MATFSFSKNNQQKFVLAHTGSISPDFFKSLDRKSSQWHHHQVPPFWNGDSPTHKASQHNQILHKPSGHLGQAPVGLWGSANAELWKGRSYYDSRGLAGPGGRAAAWFGAVIQCQWTVGGGHADWSGVHSHVNIAPAGQKTDQNWGQDTSRGSP